MRTPITLFTSTDFLPDPMKIAVTRYPEDFEVPLHAHDFIELNFVAEGKGVHYVGDQALPVRKGQVFVLPVGVAHVFRPVSSDLSKHPLHVYNCLIHTDQIDILAAMFTDEGLIRHLYELRDHRIEPYTVTDYDGSIEQLFETVYREFSSPAPGSDTYLRTLIAQIIINLYRLCYSKERPGVQEEVEFKQLLNHIRQHLHEPLTLVQLAEASRWSQRHLQRLFVKYAGQTFGSLLRHLRIQKSCEYLRLTHRKVSTIAEMVGYTHADSYTMVFKRIMGLTPSQYRCLYQKAE